MIPLQVMEEAISNTDPGRALQLSYLNIPFTMSKKDVWRPSLSRYSAPAGGEHDRMAGA
jgi:hypothetical protein